jgi:hypothetical protein
MVDGFLVNFSKFLKNAMGFLQRLHDRPPHPRQNPPAASRFLRMATILIHGSSGFWRLP